MLAISTSIWVFLATQTYQPVFQEFFTPIVEFPSRNGATIARFWVHPTVGALLPSHEKVILFVTVLILIAMIRRRYNLALEKVKQEQEP